MSHANSQAGFPRADRDATVVSERESTLAELRALRTRFVSAWQERGVVLTREEQQELRDEIEATCELLSGLTASS